MRVTESMYQSDPGAAPDTQFLPGELRYLVTGNRARLLDPRRTPVHVTAVSPETGFFEVEIDAFEDAGARWLIPLESAASYQFAGGGATVGDAGLRELRDAVARCDVQITITGGRSARDYAERRLQDESVRARGWLAEHGAPPAFDPQPFIADCAGWVAAQDWLARYLADRDL